MMAIISDTHMPHGARRLPAACLERLRGAEAIIHAGDICTLEVLAEIRALGPPVHAVHGNVDDAPTRAALPQATTIALGARTLAVLHDAGPARGRLQRMRRRFPGADAVIFGHSHIPLHETAPDGAFAILNPGSPTERRRAPCHTMGVAELEPDGRLRLAVVELD